MSDVKLFENRITELAMRARDNGFFVYTDFLTLAETDYFLSLQSKPLFKSSLVFGGDEYCERQRIRFGDADLTGYEEPFPISILRVSPSSPKFADDLNHRDFLGAIMNLGIERDVVGDIRIRDNNAYVFCATHIAAYISDSLLKVKHTDVKVFIMDEMPQDIQISRKEEKLHVASLRVDGVIAKLYHLSRSQAMDLFQAKKVIINDRIIQNNSQLLKERDIVSVRGHGKFIMSGISHISKKEKLVVIVERYV